MQRALTIALGVAVVVLAVMLVIKSTPRGTETAASLADASTSPVATDAAGAPVNADDDAGASVAIDLPPTPSEPPPDGGYRLADGTVIAPLGSRAPKQVRFGVVLVTYQGAQGAPAKARSKGEALAVATKLAEDAKADFKGAVQRGDSGSADDAGTVPRGVLEPAPEAALFSLPVGGTSGVVDTPRGFWIVKRLD